MREARVALLAREALLLRGGDDVAVAKQAGGAVVIERGDSEDVLIVHMDFDRGRWDRYFVRTNRSSMSTSRPGAEEHPHRIPRRADDGLVEAVERRVDQAGNAGGLAEGVEHRTKPRRTVAGPRSGPADVHASDGIT